MAVPKRKTSPSKRGMRRSHSAHKPVFGSACPECGSLKLPHHICGSCGYYNSREAISQNTDDEQE